MVSYSHADSIAVRSIHFLLVVWLFDAKLLLNGHAVTQNFVFVVFQQEATNWSDTLKDNSHRNFFCNSEQRSALCHKCPTAWLIYVTLIQSILVIKPIFPHILPSSYNNVKCLWLFTVSIRARSDDGKHRNKSCTDEHCLFSFKKCGFNWTQNVAIHSIIYKTPSLYIEWNKTQTFTISDVLACVSVHCADQRQHSTPDFLTKSIDNTLQTCVDIANEYLQAYNMGRCVKKNHLFWSLHDFKRAVYTRILLTIVLSN